MKNNKFFFLLLIFLLFVALFFYFFINKFKEDKVMTLEPIAINLLTNVHPNLPWNFESVKKTIIVKPGKVTSIEYLVENKGEKATTGIATFAYFPTQFESYLTKINCFCFDAQTLKPQQKQKFVLVLLIDPKVTKDSKTKDVKEITIQFTFFDYKEYKKNKS